MDNFASGTRRVAVVQAEQQELGLLKTRKERTPRVELHVPIAIPIKVGSMVAGGHLVCEILFSLILGESDNFISAAKKTPCPSGARRYGG